MSKNIVFEGWLTKSPPSKRIWRTKWRRRWFALRQSGELPGQYFLDYYADRNYRRLKGTINLDLCEQVDAGLHMERTGNGSLDPKLRGSVFTIQTQSRTYHLEADCEADMEKWVDAICRVCGLRATKESDELGSYQNNVNIASTPTEPTEPTESADSTGPYIPISECITGVRAQDRQRAFTFDPKNIVTSTRSPLERMADNREHKMYTSQPQIRLNNQDSENESSDEECKSLNTSQPNIRDYSVAKSFTKLAINPNQNIPEIDIVRHVFDRESHLTDRIAIEFSEKHIYDRNNPERRASERHVFERHAPYRVASERHTMTNVNCKNGISEEGPPVPPRPPKTFAMSRDMFQKDPAYHSSKIQDPSESTEPTYIQTYGLRAVWRASQAPLPPSSPSPVRPHVYPAVSKHSADEDEYAANQPSLQYCNLSSTPPVVDRALKPRPASHSVSSTIAAQATSTSNAETMREARPDTLQYLDLDLMPKDSPTKISNGKKVDIKHGKSNSATEAGSAYKTVDFLKTEAFNITRQDAEALRNKN